MRLLLADFYRLCAKGLSVVSAAALSAATWFALAADRIGG